LNGVYSSFLGCRAVSLLWQKAHKVRGGTEVENSAIGVVKGSIFRSETYVGLGLINIVV